MHFKEEKDMLDCLTNHTEDTWLKHIVGEASMTPPENWYVALFSADPGEDGSLADELSGNGYARVLHNAWKPAAGRRIENDGVVLAFTAAGGDWVEATHWGLVDSPTLGAGNLWVRGDLAAPVLVNNGNTYSFNDGELAVIFDTYLVYFDSGGTYEIQVDDTITGDVSGATALVADLTVISGTWASGTAAGFLVLTGMIDTLQNENISVGANSNCAAIDGEYVGVWGDYLVHKMLDLTLRGTPFSPGTLHVGYSTTNPGNDGSGMSEPTGNNYGRATASTWNPVENGLTWNAAQVNFPTPTGSWGNLGYALMSDSPTPATGNLYFYGKLLYPQNPGNAAAVYFPIGELVIGLERTTLWTTTTTTTTT